MLVVLVYAVHIYVFSLILFCFIYCCCSTLWAIKTAFRAKYAEVVNIGASFDDISKTKHDSYYGTLNMEVSITDSVAIFTSSPRRPLGRYFVFK